MDSKTELNSFFTNCIDSKYIEVVDKLHGLDSKFIKQQCKMSDEDAKELHEIVANSDENRCVNENIFKILSCFFSEPEIMQNLKNVSRAVNFHLKLFNVNHEQCGIVNKTQKYILNNIKNCNGIILQKKRNNVNFMMKLIECEVNETIDVS